MKPLNRPSIPAWLILGLLACGFSRPVLAQNLAPDPQAPKIALIVFDDPAHKPFFNYQKYLLKKNLAGETKDGWEKLRAGPRKEKIEKGEKFLKERLDHFIDMARFLNEGELEMIHDVWGQDLGKGIKTLIAAKTIRDPEQEKQALKAVSNLAKLAGMPVTLQVEAFTGEKPKPNAVFEDEAVPVEKPVGKGPLAVKTETPFLDSLESKEIREVLSSQDRFETFLNERSTQNNPDGQVAKEAIPGLIAMYAVLSEAEGDEKKDLDHLLPTVVRFLNDGKKIASESMPGAYGLAYPGKYDRPEKVGVSDQLDKAPPIIVGDVLAHEFQHIYDMYTGRYYTIDSEMRGFKVEVMYYHVLKKAAPAKYKELASSDDDGTRGHMRDVAQYSKAYESDPTRGAFFREIATGHRYNQWNEGYFEGRFPLKETLDPIRGAARDLAAFNDLSEQARKAVSDLEEKQKNILAQLKAQPSSRGLDKELEKVTSDLQSAQGFYNDYSSQAVIKGIRLNRMQSELNWLMKKDPQAAFDLNLPVDKEYFTP